MDIALEAFSDAITNTWFSHAEMERPGVIYQVRHKTTYDYEDPVSVSHHILRLTPRNTRAQTCRKTEIAIIPRPPAITWHTDYFGNRTGTFTLLEPHDRLIVEAMSEIEVTAPALPRFRRLSAMGKRA